MAGVFDEVKHPRARGGRFGAKSTGAAASSASSTPAASVVVPGAKTSGVTEADHINVVAAGMRKYKSFDTVGDYVNAHPKGRLAALKTLAADEKAGKIAFTEMRHPRDAQGRFIGAGAGSAEPKPRKSRAKKTPSAASGTAPHTVPSTTTSGPAVYAAGMSRVSAEAKAGGVDHYFGPRSDYIEINVNLRAGGRINPRVKGYIDNLDKAFSEAAIVHGGETVYRGLNVPSTSKLARLKPGSVIKEKGFMSTTTDKSEAMTFVRGRLGRPKTKTMLMHLSGSGSSVLYNADESELLFNRGSMLTVTHTEVGDDGVVHVHATY